MKKRFIYLDNAATTPIRKEVLAAMKPFFQDVFGNPSSLHFQGRASKKVLEDSKKIISNILNSKVEEIVFTAGGTESCNLAIFGLAQTFSKPQHIIVSSVEHPSVLEPTAELERRGWQITRLPVSPEGSVSLESVKKAIRKETVLISIMYANNEIGTIQPIQEIGKLIFQINSERIKRGLEKIYFHTDACQASGFLDLNVQGLGVDMLTLNGSKIYGPKQTGLLFIKKNTPLRPLVLGGGQELGFRSGTENVSGVVGFAKALELAQKEKNKTTKRLFDLRQYFIIQAEKNIPSFKINGFGLSSFKVLPNNINFSIKGILGEDLVIYLDAKGVCVSTGSACSNLMGKNSYVLKAIGLEDKVQKSSIRVSMGKDTTKQEIKHLIDSVKDSLKLISNK